MRLFCRLLVASGLLVLACATPVEEGPLADHAGEETGGSANTAGSLATSGTTSSAGSLPSAGTTSASGGKGGTGATAFGGTSTSGGTSAKGGSGSGSGGASAGSSSGGKAGTASGGSATGGTNAGGTASAGTANGGTGTGTAGSTSTTCAGVADWSSKTYAMGDTVASTCNGVFAGGCPMGQSHKFECNPTAGSAALPWCMSREPGVGNGWDQAWVDKGKCQ